IIPGDDRMGGLTNGVNPITGEYFNSGNGVLLNVYSLHWQHLLLLMKQLQLLHSHVED
ncbi:hypothetical protein MKW98_006148, partial [Papaver atlanticum]